MDPQYLCFVLGCHEETTIGCRHKIFGLVVACVGHNPIKHGYDKPFRDVAKTALGAVEPASKDGGQRVRRVPRIPRIPPQGATA